MKFDMFDELDAGGRPTRRLAMAQTGLRPKDEGNCRWYLRAASTAAELSTNLDARFPREASVICRMAGLPGCPVPNRGLPVRMGARGAPMSGLTSIGNKRPGAR